MQDVTPRTSRNLGAGSNLTAAQHREMADLLRAQAGRPGFPATERAEELVERHETMAAALEQREQAS